MVQRRAAWYVFDDCTRFSHVTPILHQLGWRSLMQRRADIRRLVFTNVCMAWLLLTSARTFLRHGKQVGTILSPTYASEAPETI